ncbi:hypothetical protein YTPLAS18_07340 [Nitrospira sp.]|nr:hypothetical protein YTPLAS18_07340 [Nitrospira sp.]
MSEPSPSELGVHESALLLPWFVTDRLSPEERDRVRIHVESCALCREELAELTQQRDLLRSAYTEQAPPPRDLMPAILSKVKAAAMPTREPSQRRTRSTTDIVEEWFRNLLRPRWVPAFATVLIALQAGLLWWVSVHAPAQPASGPGGEVVERGIPPQGTRVIVVFNANTTADQIRTLLGNVHGRIIDGPRPDGRYMVLLPGGDPATLDQSMAVLRARSNVVELAERANP